MLPAQSSPARMRLSDLPVGARGRVCELEGQAQFCQRLREMGFCESAVIEKVSGQHTLLCQVCGMKIALSGRAADHIVVELVRGGHQVF
ncbi:ferrous iron transport protein A [Nibricoccus sp. IMCC34717]|uniref:FeoA family protein n=1 Tax=Nibricoccus sp. IMCC34717 TaxID=3034021 RepID=UPI00384CF7D1